MSPLSNSVGIVDLQPGGQAINDQQPRVPRLALGDLQRDEDAVILGQMFEVGLRAVELEDAALDCIAFVVGGFGLGERAGH